MGVDFIVFVVCHQDVNNANQAFQNSKASLEPASWSEGGFSSYRTESCEHADFKPAFVNVERGFEVML